MVDRSLSRSSVILELERCMVPASLAENSLQDDIRSLTFYSVARLPQETLEQMSMLPQQCHNNVHTYAKADPTGESKVVPGWWKRGDVFVLHSVVLSRDLLHCVTPHADGEPILFAPDPAIAWADADQVLRDGQSFPTIVRNEPEAVIAKAKKARDALLAGADLGSVTFPF
ncbi:hypothetical protein [Sphingobium sp. CECT 9361]|uniref:hypothetical protein n=1 Tax=Sphingobium sp. CECT 9361 TaxID=2845384 RepID=UPI001E385683|nr:hypothetical protein [Sphingobium sp. CECT 9361]